MESAEFYNQTWTKLVKQYYEEIKILDKRLPPEVKVCVMMQVEDFAEWLQNKGRLTDEVNG